MVAGQDTGFTGERLLEPHLLLLLCRKADHGYELIARLARADFTDGEVDPATVYRNLRRMEREGLVGSRWEAGRSGPARRLYEVTARGRQALAAWSETINRQREKLSVFLAEFERLRPQS